MSSAPPSPSPTPTVLGERAHGEQLAAQHFHLVLLDTERAGTLYPLGGEVLRIGNAPDNDVVLDHPTVSRNHLVVRRQGDRFLVQDLDSIHGTFLDGSQVREAWLRPGVLLEVGDVRLRFNPQVAPVELAPSEAPTGEQLPVAYSGPFKARKDELVRAFEREYLTRLLGRTKGNIARAAREAELDRKHFYSLLHKYGLVQSEED